MNGGIQLILGSVATLIMNYIHMDPFVVNNKGLNRVPYCLDVSIYCITRASYTLMTSYICCVAQ